MFATQIAVFAQDTTDETVSEVTESAQSMWETVLASLPRIGIAVVLVVVGWLISRLVRRLLKNVMTRRNQTESFATVMSKLGGWLFLGLFILFGVTVIAPSIEPVDLLAGLGFFSVAIGFAFQDILENLLAGILLLFRQPFSAGDQVDVNGQEGTVERITIRETRIRTFDGQRVLVPNADVYKNAIRVQTAFPERRVDFSVGVSYDTDLSEARTAIETALAETDGVRTDPGPEAFVTELGASSVNFQARFWCDPAQLDSLLVQDRAIENAKIALDDLGIEIPFDIVTLEAGRTFNLSDAGGG